MEIDSSGSNQKDFDQSKSFKDTWRTTASQEKYCPSRILNQSSKDKSYILNKYLEILEEENQQSDRKMPKGYEGIHRNAYRAMAKGFAMKP